MPFELNVMVLNRIIHDRDGRVNWWIPARGTSRRLGAENDIPRIGPGGVQLVHRHKKVILS